MYSSYFIYHIVRLITRFHNLNLQSLTCDGGIPFFTSSVASSHLSKWYEDECEKK